MPKSRSKNILIPKTFDTYISKVLKQMHPKLSISSNVKSQINYLLLLLASKIIDEAISLLLNRKTIDTRSIQAAVRNVFESSNMEKHAISEATKAVIKYTSAGGYFSKSKKKIGRTDKAGLRFSVSRVENIIRNKYKGRIGDTCSVYLAAVLEYTAAEILELSGNSAIDNKRSTINSKDLMLAIKRDDELINLINNINFEILGGGVIPGIHSVLLKSKKSKKSSKRRSRRSSKRRSRKSSKRRSRKSSKRSSKRSSK